MRPSSEWVGCFVSPWGQQTPDAVDAPVVERSLFVVPQAAATTTIAATPSETATFRIVFLMRTSPVS
jgi:hypothetical protein